MARILCDEDVAYVKKRLEDIDKFLSLYGWLMNSYTTVSCLLICVLIVG